MDDIKNIPAQTDSTETKLGMTYEQFVRKYLENDPYEFMAHIDAMWASLPADPKQ
jgi:hypothetical protein